MADPASSSSSSSFHSSATPSSSHSSTPSTPFRPHYANLLGTIMFDDNVRLLSEFLFAHSSVAEVEIEGKLGLVFSQKKDARIHIDGVRGLVCISSDEIDAAFAAEVDANMFRHINENILQRRVREENARAKQQGGKPVWQYEHKHIIDKFHTVGNDRVRVSYSPEGTILECICKDKLQHLDFWNGKPKCIDFRISANKERKIADIPRSECDQIRKKERMSYQYDLFKIELSRVDLYKSCKNNEPVNERPDQTSFEVEVELYELAFLRQEALKAKMNQPNEFVKIVSAFLETMRTLAQYALPPSLPPGWKPMAAPAAPLASSSSSSSASAAAAAGKKRAREEEQTSSKNDDYGKAWS